MSQSQNTKRTHDLLEKIHTEENHNDKVNASSTEGMNMYLTEQPPITCDNGRNGWLYKKISATDKINWFYYGAGNTYTTIADLKSLNSLISIDVYVGNNSLPYFKVYSKATGINDYSWYKSSITYTLKSGEKIHLGEEIQAWSGVKPKKQSNRRMVEFVVSGVNTLGTDTSIEELLSISIHTSSASPIGTKILVSEVGFVLYGGDEKVVRRIELNI